MKKQYLVKSVKSDFYYTDKFGGKILANFNEAKRFEKFSDAVRIMKTGETRVVALLNGVIQDY